MTVPGDPAAGDEAARLRRRLERERQARLEAERVAETATRRLLDALTELTEAEARSRIVADTAAAIFGGALEEEPTLRAIVDSARRALRAARATLYVLSDDAAAVRDVHTTEDDPAAGAALAAARGARPEDLPGWRPAGHGAEPVVEEATAEGGLIAIRLAHASVVRAGLPAVLGLLVLDVPHGLELTAGERTAVRSLAGLASIALANARLHARTLSSLEEARERAARDPLTGLANHRVLQERLAAETARALRHGRQLSLAVLDLDHFKRVNDDHGHRAGDVVLVEVARVLEDRARVGDVVARVGGEEFAWLMPETDGLAAWQAAESARVRLAATELPAIGRVTVSAGVCDLAQAGTAERLYTLADDALYWAKHRGRDVVIRYTPDLVEVLTAEEQTSRVARLQALQGIEILARAVDAKTAATRGHSERVAHLCAAIADELGWPPDRVRRLRQAAVVHDVGKVGVPEAVLLKAAALSPEEHAGVRPHAALGAEMLVDVLDGEQVAWVRCHHERPDGRGYPDGLVGDAVPDGARIIGAAEAWDVMTTGSLHRLPMSEDDALDECRRLSGEQFAPEAVEALGRVVAARATSGEARQSGSPPPYSRR